jgi:hypothetical protein
MRSKPSGGYAVAQGRTSGVPASISFSRQHVLFVMMHKLTSRRPPYPNRTFARTVGRQCSPERKHRVFAVEHRWVLILIRQPVAFTAGTTDLHSSRWSVSARIRILCEAPVWRRNSGETSLWRLRWRRSFGKSLRTYWQHPRSNSSCQCRNIGQVGSNAANTRPQPWHTFWRAACKSRFTKIYFAKSAERLPREVYRLADDGRIYAEPSEYGEHRCCGDRAFCSSTTS